MLLIDSSVWIQVLQRHLNLRDLPGSPDEWAVTEPILMEVLAGALDFEAVRSHLNSVTVRQIDPARDYESAALLFRSVLRTGHTIRSLNDCLITAVALRNADTVAHRDADFEALTQICDLTTVDLR